MFGSTDVAIAKHIRGKTVGLHFVTPSFLMNVGGTANEFQRMLGA